MKDFAADGVVYAELRSTPRAVEGRMAKRQYVQALVEAVHRCNNSCSSVAGGGDHTTRQGAFGPLGIQTRVLVSIDRGQSLEAAEESFALAEEFRQLYPGVIVGIDVSGNPTKNDIALLAPLLKRAVASGFKTAVHLAEVPNEVEVSGFLNPAFFVPDRIGHGVEIHPSTRGGSEILWKKLLGKHCAHRPSSWYKTLYLISASKIPVEVCLTSNKLATSVSDLRKHPVQHLVAAGHPIAICTDDKGLFGVSLADEYHSLDELFDVGATTLVELIRNSAQHAFCDSDLKVQLNSYIKQESQNILEELTLDMIK